MGYDMYWLRSPDGEAEAEEAANKVFRRACDTRDALPRGSAEAAAAQVQVSAAYDAMYEARKSYFRLNVWGMGTVRQAMLNVGMAYEGDSSGDWPEFPDEFYELDDEERAVAFPKETRERDTHLAWSERPADAGVSLHKFGSNDGWIVTPDECTAAVALAHKLRDEQPKRYGEALIAAGVNNEGWLETWNDWLQWIADAAEHGGFTVH
jgi:hypothetical protein